MCLNDARRRRNLDSMLRIILNSAKWGLHNPPELAWNICEHIFSQQDLSITPLLLFNFSFQQKSSFPVFGDSTPKALNGLNGSSRPACPGSGGGNDFGMMPSPKMVGWAAPPSVTQNNKTASLNICSQDMKKVSVSQKKLVKFYIGWLFSVDPLLFSTSFYPLYCCCCLATWVK